MSKLPKERPDRLGDTEQAMPSLRYRSQLSLIEVITSSAAHARDSQAVPEYNLWLMKVSVPVGWDAGLEAKMVVRVA